VTVADESDGGLRPGKLPSAMLAELLGSITHRDPRVLVGPGIGRDAAVIDLGDRMLVAKTDPITFATDEIGWYAVQVNANDIACMGARPAWFLATALLPPGAPADLPARIFGQITAACDTLGIALVGGHTEVTLGLDRPIIAGAMLGEATRDEIVTGEGVSEGSIVLLSKGIAIEGTALLAREAAGALRRRGVNDATIQRAASMLHDPGISVVADARALAAAGRPSLMHDPTEGGLATALHEMAEACGRTLHIDATAVPVFDETRAVCDALGLDPMGLLASGALLAIVPAGHPVVASAGRSDALEDFHAIGRVGSGRARVILGDEATAEPMPSFARDELARFFDSARDAGGVD
jgi:hydrogenase maturation factor